MTSESAKVASHSPPALDGWISVGVITLLGLVLGYTTMSHLGQGIGDEDVHSFQIRWFMTGNFQVFEHLPMPPVYHALVAALANLWGDSQNVLRAAHLLIAAWSLPVFYCLARRTVGNESGTRTLQFFLLPILFPLFFLIYTDIPALIFTLAMVERTLARRYLAASLFALVAIAMRQPNLIWVAYAGLLAVFQEDLLPTSLDRLKQGVKRFWPFAGVFALFAVFVVINGGVAIGDAAQHPVSLNLSNLYFFLLVAFFLFLPLNIEYARAAIGLFRRHKWLILPWLALFCLYMLTYEHPHKYNATALSYYRHNLLLHWTCDILPIRVLSYLPISWMALTFYLAACKSAQPLRLYLLYPFAALSFIPMPLIEQRYYLPALVLFIALRPRQSRLGEIATLVIYIGFVGYFMYNISRANFFL